MKQSNGTAGERAAEYWFKHHNWKMFRTQPPTKTIWAKGHAIVINCESGGIADYTGYILDGTWRALYAGCEVKEHDSTDDMPHSRLKKPQREWMEAIPEQCRYVGILWRDGVFTMHRYEPGRGSYRRQTAIMD